MNPTNPTPSAADLLDRTARAAAGDTPVDVGAVLVRVRSNRRRRAGRVVAGTALALAAGLVVAGGLVPRLGALPPPVGSEPAPSAPVLLPDELKEPRLDPPLVIGRDGQVRARRLSMGLVGALHGQEVAVAVDAGTGRLVRLPATDDDLPGLGVPSNDLVGFFPRTQVLLSPGGTVAAVVTLHLGGCQTVLVDLAGRRVLPAQGLEPCAPDGEGLAVHSAAVLPLDDATVVQPGPSGDTLRRQAPPGSGAKGAPPAWEVAVPDLASGDLLTVEALNGDQALVRTTNGEGRRRAWTLDLATGRLGPELADLAVVAGSVVRPDPTGPLWYLTRSTPVVLRRDTVLAGGGTDPAGGAVPVPDGVLSSPARVVGVNAGQAVLADIGQTSTDGATGSTLARLDPATGRLTRWVRAPRDGAWGDRWSLPVDLLARAEVVPAPAEPWWAVLAPLTRVPFWSWPGLALLALVGLPGILVWRRRRRPGPGRV